MKTIWKWILSLFTAENVAKVWKILFNGAVTATVTILTNEALMNTAYEISLSLLGLKAPSDEKREQFNIEIQDWCIEKKVPKLTEAQLNVVREIAYAAIRSEYESRGTALPGGNN